MNSCNDLFYSSLGRDYSMRVSCKNNVPQVLQDQTEHCFVEEPSF